MRSVVVGLALPVCLASMTKVLPKGQLPLIAGQEISLALLSMAVVLALPVCLAGHGAEEAHYVASTPPPATAERLLESLSASASCLPVEKFCILQPQIILSMFVTSLRQRGKFRFSCRYRKASDGKASQHWRLLCQRLLSKICMFGATVPENQKPSIEKVLFLKQTEAWVKEFNVMEFLNSCLHPREPSTLPRIIQANVQDSHDTVSEYLLRWLESGSVQPATNVTTATLMFVTAHPFPCHWHRLASKSEFEFYLCQEGHLCDVPHPRDGFSHKSLSAAGCLPVQKFCILQPQIILSMFSLAQRGKVVMLRQNDLPLLAINRKSLVPQANRGRNQGIPRHGIPQLMTLSVCLSDRFICSSPSAAVFVLP